MQVGCGNPDITIPLMSMGFREVGGFVLLFNFGDDWLHIKVNIVTSFRYTLSWPSVIRLVAAGVFGDVTQLITHVLPIEKTVEAFEIVADRSQNAIKVQVRPESLQPKNDC